MRDTPTWRGRVGAKAVTVYAPGSSSAQQTISEGVNQPTALGFNPSRRLYVANARSNTVTVYAPGSTKLLTTYRFKQQIRTLAIRVGR